MRITSAADDAAGSAVATNLATQARSGRQAIRNANDGISVIEPAESASKEVLNILDRMRELAVQSSSETLEDSEQAYIDSGFEQLSDEVEGVSRKARSSTESPCQQAVRHRSSRFRSAWMRHLNSQVTIELGDLTASTLGVDTGSVDLSAATGAQAAIRDIKLSAIDTVNSVRASYGATQNRLEFDQQHGELCGGTVFCGRRNAGCGLRT